MMKQVFSGGGRCFDEVKIQKKFAGPKRGAANFFCWSCLYARLKSWSNSASCILLASSMPAFVQLSLNGHLHTCEFSQSFESTNKRVTRVSLALEVVQQLYSMVGSHRHAMVFSSRLLSSPLFL